MGGRGGGKVQKVMVQPINLIFRYLQNKSRIQIWLYENVNTRIDGQIIGITLNHLTWDRRIFPLDKLRF